MEKNRQVFSPNLDHSLKIEVERSSARFLFLAARRQKRRQHVEKPQFSRIFRQAESVFQLRVIRFLKLSYKFRLNFFEKG